MSRNTALPPYLADMQREIEDYAACGVEVSYCGLEQAESPAPTAAIIVNLAKARTDMRFLRYRE